MTGSDFGTGKIRVRLQSTTRKVTLVDGWAFSTVLSRRVLQLPDQTM